MGKQELRIVEIEATDNGYLIRLTRMGEYSPGERMVVTSMSDLMGKLTRVLFEHEDLRDTRINPKPTKDEEA